MNPSSNRRQFLQQASQTSAVLAAATSLGGVHVFADEKPVKVRLGIIGCGGIMTSHVQGLVDRLDFDPAIERFVDCDEANSLLSKNYREPYGLPETSP